MEKISQDELIEVKEERIAHNIPAVKAKIIELRKELEKYEAIIAEDETFEKKEEKGVITWERIKEIEIKK